ncbi:unnamed protein product [Clonostachys byssicola]|uniref:Uncharacterized protein n=1 Tax=Clonostachys byssicola TaxID=160290 RepID=A0A9N9V1Q2_9HYPO|nr:unnamed protein product [Clonostachys byssicola]
MENQKNIDHCSWQIAAAKGRIGGTKEEIKKEASPEQKQKLESELAGYENDLKHNEEKRKKLEKKST